MPGQFDASRMLVVPLAIIDLQPESAFQQLIDQAIFPAGKARVHWHPISSVVTQDVEQTIWKRSLWGGAIGALDLTLGPGLSDLNGSSGDLVVSRHSQTINQLDAGTAFGNTAHSAFDGMEAIGLTSQVLSQNIFERIRTLLSTGDSHDWQGNLSQ